MADGTPKDGETGTPKAPENGTPTSAPTTGNAGDSAELERLRKERDQAQMRANQLEKEKKAREDADAASKAKELEEQNEFKTLHEQEKAKREELEAQIEADKKAKDLKKAKKELLADFSDEVKALAEEAGMTLASTDEAEKEAFKEKLDKIQTRLGSSGKVGPNNPGKSNGKQELSQDELRLSLKSGEGFEAEMAKRPGLAAMLGKQPK